MMVCHRFFIDTEISYGWLFFVSKIYPVYASKNGNTVHVNK